MRKGQDMSNNTNGNENNATSNGNANGGPLPPARAAILRYVDDGQHYKPAVLAAVRDFRDSKPWAGTREEREEKFKTLHAAFCSAYEINLRLAFMLPELSGSTFGILDASQELILSGKLSVITYFLAIATARGFDFNNSARWAITLFARVFPQSFARLEMRGGRIASVSTAAE